MMSLALARRLIVLHPVFMRTALGMAMAAETCAGGAAQRPQLDRNDWTVESAMSGGIAGIRHSVTLAHDGTLEASDSRLRFHVTAKVSPQVVANVASLLATAEPAKPAGRAMPDAIESGLVVTTGGRKIPLQPIAAVAKALDDAFYDAVSRGIVGEWRQASWKLCSPATQIGAADVDPPIDKLRFDERGIFAVTWTGGQKTTPDYSGHYTVAPAAGAIHMRADLSPDAPKDFSGEGTFGLSEGTLTLRNIWLGTKQAKQRPDVCELTFTRR
jgi:hypothetical protein